MRALSAPIALTIACAPFAVLKFYFVRVQEPWMSSGPSWNHSGDDAWRPVDGVGQDDDSAEATWRWLLGKAPVEPAQPVAGVAVPMALLREDNEAPTEKERAYSTLNRS